MDADVYNTIKQRALQTDSHLSSTARRNLAIARRWEGKVDIVVRALVLGPLAAYVGIGTFQVFENEADGDLRVWIPSREAIQLYVPGLKEKNPNTGALIYRDAFARVEQTRIGWDPTC